MTGSTNFPIWMEPLNGNSSDKTSSYETISRVRAFQKQLKTSNDFFWITDLALYTPDKLLACPEVYWLSRVPETIKKCASLVSILSESVEWTVSGSGYKWSEFESLYGGIQQRWLLVFSQQAYERERKTLLKNIEKKRGEYEKTCRNMSNQLFACCDDAKKQVEKLNKKYRYHLIEYTIETVEKYECRGRPNPL